MIKLNAQALRLGEHNIDKANLAKNEIYIILDNVLDTYNIGSVFRLADAIACKKVYLCEGTETPPNHRIKKASINTTEVVEWEYFDKTVEAIHQLKKEVPQIKVVAVEQAETSILYTDYQFNLPVALVVGHETHGVSSDVLGICDGIVEMPMYGVNISLNVMVSLGIVVYEVLRQTKKTE